MKLCRHANYHIIDWVREPRYHDDSILINTGAIIPGVEHYIIKFTNCNQYPDWFYMSGKVIRRHHTQANGSSNVYVVPMGKREAFEPIKNCTHNL
jgi:hypothetical protein